MDGQQFIDTLKANQQAAWDGLRPDQTLVLEYHSQAGERIRIGRIYYYPPAETLYMDGEDKDRNLCRAVIPVQAVQLIMRIVERGGEPRRNPIGFTTTEEPPPPPSDRVDF